MKFFEGQFNALCVVWAMHLWAANGLQWLLNGNYSPRTSKSLTIALFNRIFQFFRMINSAYISFRFCCRECCLLSSPIAGTLGPLTKGDVTEINKMFGTWACQSQQGSYTPLSNTSICSRQSKFYSQSRGWKALHGQQDEIKHSNSGFLYDIRFDVCC